MAKTMQFDARMSFKGESSFDVWRFGYDPSGFHDRRGGGDANSDSLNLTRLGLQTLCYVIQSQKTMLLLKRSDLITIRLVEAHLQGQTFEEAYFAARESANGFRTTHWVSSLFMKNVSIIGLKTRQPLDIPIFGAGIVLDWVALRAEEMHVQDYDSQGNHERQMIPGVVRSGR